MSGPSYAGIARDSRPFLTGDARAEMARRERAEYREKNPAADTGEPSVLRQQRGPILRFTIKGKSMLPKFKPGVMVDCRIQPADAPIIAGKNYYIERKDGRACFRHVALCQENGIYLRALKPEKAPIQFVPYDQIALAAVAIGIIVPIKYSRIGTLLWKIKSCWWDLKDAIADAIANLRAQQKSGVRNSPVHSPPASKGMTGAIEPKAA